MVIPVLHEVVDHSGHLAYADRFLEVTHIQSKIGDIQLPHISNRLRQETPILPELLLFMSKPTHIPDHPAKEPRSVDLILLHTSIHKHSIEQTTPIQPSIDNLHHPFVRYVQNKELLHQDEWHAVRWMLQELLEGRPG